MKTANNKIPVSSIFNNSEGLHGTTVCRCLVLRPHNLRSGVIFFLLLCFFGTRGKKNNARERHKGIIGRGHDLRLQASLFHAANAFRVVWSERVRHRNALTQIAWENAVQGLGMAMSTVASEKNREMLFIGNVFYKQ